MFMTKTFSLLLKFAVYFKIVIETYLFIFNSMLQR